MKAEEILKGNISISPYRRKELLLVLTAGMSICQFDTRISDMVTGIFWDRKDEEVWKLMEGK